MIISAVFSKPVKNITDFFDRPYIKIRIRKNPSLTGAEYVCESFTEKQAFQKSMTEKQVEEFFITHAGISFKNAVKRTEAEETTVMANKKGEVRTIIKKIKNQSEINSTKLNRKKNYIISEGLHVPFLVELGVMTKEGKIVAKKYDKFRQINRFLELIDDVIDSVLRQKTELSEDNPLRIIDFGSGKSYLTFAVHYFLHDLRKIPVEIIGLDLKEDVIKNCSDLSRKLNCSGLHFETGDIAGYKNENDADIIITLHACDTATDYALDYAVKKNAKAILSVPCCQHEINLQLSKQKLSPDNPYSLFTKYGILQERFSALVTDALRCEMLEEKGYDVQMLEFIDMEGTPKNLMIRAVKRSGKKNMTGHFDILKTLNVRMTGIS